MRELWRKSLTFRRIIAALSVALAALLMYFASNIPQTATLPEPTIDQRAVAKTPDELRLYKPQVNVGDAVLSFEGAANTGAEVWAPQATITGNSPVLTGPQVPRGPANAVYAAAETQPAPGAAAPAKAADTTSTDCRTSFTVIRPQTSKPPQMLRLSQQQNTRQNLHYRQITLTASDSPLAIEVKTDTDSGTLCPRVLKMDAQTIPVPFGPVDLLVPPNQPITFLFSSIDPRVPLFSGQDVKKATFDDLSLGDDDLAVGGLDIVSGITQKTPILHVVAAKGTPAFTLHDLELGAEELSVSVGKDKEKADAWNDGKKFPVFNLVDQAQKNPVIAFLLAAVLLPGLWKWIQHTCFPEQKAETSKTEAAS